MPIDSTPLSTTFSVCVRQHAGVCVCVCVCVCMCVIGRGHVREVISIYSVRLPDHVRYLRFRVTIRDSACLRGGGGTTFIDQRTEGT